MRRPVAVVPMTDAELDAIEREASESARYGEAGGWDGTAARLVQEIKLSRAVGELVVQVEREASAKRAGFLAELLEGFRNPEGCFCDAFRQSQPPIIHSQRCETIRCALGR